MSESNKYDVVIVGAGPAGSSAAYSAARSGASVAFLEREDAVASTVRTSGVTWMDTVKEFDIPDDCYNPIRNYAFFSPNNEVTVKDTEPRAVVLNVRKTYRLLASRAQDAGAQLFTRTNVTDAIVKDGTITGVHATTSDGVKDFEAKIVIDASGFQSTVARITQSVKRWNRFGVGAEWEARAENVSEDTWWLLVGSKYSPAGYAWVFPLGNNMIRIGVGIAKPASSQDPAARLQYLMEHRPGPLSRLGKIEPVEYHYGLIPNDGVSRKSVHNGMIMVGDSAGQANPLVLEGIRYAIRYGRLAGQTASRAAQSGDVSASSLQHYEEHWRAQIGSKIRAALRVQERWLKLDDKEWDAELNLIREFSVDEFLDFVKAEFGLGYVAHMALAHPKIAARQLVRLVRDSLQRT